jgi:hypothetical protein
MLGPMYTLRRALAFASVFVCGSVCAQYAPAPGVRDSFVPVLVLPWIILILSAGISLSSRMRPYRSLVLRPIACSVAGVISTIALLFGILSLTSGLLHEAVAFVTFYTILFSGPLALLLALLIAASAFLVRAHLRRTDKL